MEAFRNLLVCFEHKEVRIDIIAKLPYEISNLIFSMLDEESLHTAAYVSHTWRSMYEYQRKCRQLRDPDVNMKRRPDIKSKKKLKFFKLRNECFLQIDMHRSLRDSQRKMKDNERLYAID
ncbi:hypothetical protein P5V15_009975 [Pogonomyrmex californicus]